jgi:hypothetical protein
MVRIRAMLFLVIVARIVSSVVTLGGHTLRQLEQLETDPIGAMRSRTCCHCGVESERETGTTLVPGEYGAAPAAHHVVLTRCRHFAALATFTAIYTSNTAMQRKCSNVLLPCESRGVARSRPRRAARKLKKAKTHCNMCCFHCAKVVAYCKLLLARDI